jgi:hypothetical protein
VVDDRSSEKGTFVPFDLDASSESVQRLRKQIDGEDFVDRGEPTAGAKNKRNFYGPYEKSAYHAKGSAKMPWILMIKKHDAGMLQWL